MNRKVLAILILTVTALAVLTMFSFGPLAGWRKRASINPASNIPQGGQQTTIMNHPVHLINYLNRDVRENYYGFSAPNDWQVRSGIKPGSYLLTFPHGEGELSLMDVPDNSTLELYLLSQQEPALKKAAANYVRKGYLILTIDSVDAYQLEYTCIDNGRWLVTRKTYITGSDNAAVLTFRVDQAAFPVLSPMLTTVTGSFTWKNKR